MQKKQLLPKVSELWLHYIWKSGSLLNYDLFSVCRQPIKILFVGWYNKSWGADFKDARILIDQKEYFGDVEIHIDENDWFSHGHHNKQSYNRTILHVFLSKGAKRAFNEIQTEIASLNLGESYLDSFWREKKLPQNICLEELPGACGILLRPEKYPALKNLIFQAAKSRMIKKSESFNSDLNSLHASPEEILFISIFRSLGYNAFVDQFVLMAKIFPYGLLIGFFKDSLRQSRTEILGRWLGFMDFFCKTPPDKINDELRREWQAMRQLWQSIKKTVPQLEFETHAPYRPYNNPLRRLSGFYYHLEKIEFHGLIKSWLKFLWDCGAIIDKKENPKPLIIELLDMMFPQPEWDPLCFLIKAESKNKLNGKTRFIGKDRQLIILVNSVIPFFLAWSKKHGNQELEKTLFSLFLLLPPEGKNKKTVFLEQRLFVSHPEFKIINNLGYYQGLIQLYDDCCRSFYEGCLNCSLLERLK